MKCHEKGEFALRVVSLRHGNVDPYFAQTAPAERLLMMRPLTVQAWAFKGVGVGESRSSRHVVRVVRRGC